MSSSTTIWIPAAIGTPMIAASTVKPEIRSRDTGAELALGAAVLQIVGWALVAGRRAGWTWLRAGVFAAVEGALGVVLLLLERLLH